jgi:hypothetical protein
VAHGAELNVAVEMAKSRAGSRSKSVFQIDDDILDHDVAPGNKRNGARTVSYPWELMTRGGLRRDRAISG